MLRAVPLSRARSEAAPQEAGLQGSGLRPCTPGGLPFIGRFRRYGNLMAATGHAMIGVSLAPITGKLVAEIVRCRIPSIDRRLLRPDRCIESERP